MPTPIPVPVKGSPVVDNTGKVVGTNQFDPNTGAALPNTPAAPAAPTIGTAYKSFASPSPDSTDAGLSYVGDTAKTAAETPVDENAIRSSVLGQFQSEIDATNAIYAQKLAEAKQQGLNDLGSGRAIAARSGTLGSDFAASQKGKIEDANTANENSITNEQQAAIDAIEGKASTEADSEIAAKRTAQQAGLSSYLTYLGQAADRAKTNTDSLSQSFISQGISPDQIDPAQLSKIATSYGITPDAITANYKTAKSTYDDAQQKQAASEAFNLSPGQTRYNADGTVAASVPTDPLDDELKKAQIAKIANDISTSSGVGAADVTSLLGTLNDYNGTKYVTPTDLEGYSAKDKNSLIASLKSNGIQTLSAKDSDALSSINSAKSDLSDFNTYISTGADGGKPVLPTNWLGQPEQAANVTLNKYLQTNGQLDAFNTWKLGIIPIITALKGAGSGGGGSSRLFSTIDSLVPQNTDTLSVAQNKITTLNKLLDNGASSILKAPATGVTVPLPDGTSASFPDQASADKFKKAAGL